MERWQKKIAVVTGASTGIGAACAKDLAKAGMIVIGLARREGLVADLREELPDEAKNRLHTLKCDVTKEAEVIKAFSRIEGKFGGVDLLINNAGIVRPDVDLLHEQNTADLQAVLNTNVMGVAYCTREAFKTMKERNVDGQVIIINCTAGHCVPVIPGQSFNMYAPSKHACTALAEVYRQELLSNNTRIKITSISPGFVDTEIISEESKLLFKDVPKLKPEDVSAAVMYVIQTPPGVQVHELVIKPIGESF